MQKINAKVTKNGKVTMDDNYTWDEFCGTFHPFLVEHFKNIGTQKITIEDKNRTIEYTLLS